MIDSQARRIFNLGLLFACWGLASGCGDDSANKASGGPLMAPSEISSANAGENRAPEITSMRFEPTEAVPGKTLRVHVGASDPDRDPVELGHVWKINNRRTPVSGSVFEIPANLRKGDEIEVSVIASDGAANSEPMVRRIVVGNRRPTVEEIRIHIRGNVEGQLGRWVADPVGRDLDGDEITYRYSWIVNGRSIEHYTAELDRATRKRGDEIRLIVWAMDGESESAPLKSALFTIGNSAPDIVSRPPGMDPSGLFTYAVQARDRDGDRGLRYSLDQGPKGMTIDAFSGELRWQASYRQAGEHIVVIGVDDRHGGVTTQTFYLEVSTGPARRR